MSCSTLVFTVIAFAVASYPTVDTASGFTKSTTDGAQCPSLFSSTLLPLFTQCPASEQCSDDVECPGTKQCCQNYQVKGNLTHPQFCVGQGCTCPNITALCPELNCWPWRYKIDTVGCSICACAANTVTSIANATNTTTATTPRPPLTRPGLGCRNVTLASCKQFCGKGSLVSVVYNPSIGCHECVCHAEVPTVTPPTPSCHNVTVASCKLSCKGAPVSVRYDPRTSCHVCVCHNSTPTAMTPTLTIPSGCRNVTVASCQTSCGRGSPVSIVHDPGTGCPECLCHELVTTNAPVITQMKAGYTYVRLYTDMKARATLNNETVRFARAVVTLLILHYNWTAQGIIPIKPYLVVLCCSTHGQMLAAVHFQLSCVWAAQYTYYSSKLITDGEEGRLSFFYRDTHGSLIQMTSGGTDWPTRAAPTTVPAATISNTQIIIYACSGGGAVLVVIIIVLAILICKRGKTGRAEFYEDPAPGVRYNPLEGVLDRTINTTAYPEAATRPQRQQPQLVFDQPIYDNTTDTEQLVQDVSGAE